uniref:Uncharacterized protein n=1 Tax=Utricularia reniformis TaxID=192314 RepID=A0A1Y0B216_9LAMI|nr:hypothetical protein AEK19_MT1291 [Utricularia reniformis]ART31495.1 hypothetical protein AEK19_MT1291 [Utricularia reniformis]
MAILAVNWIGLWLMIDGCLLSKMQWFIFVLLSFTSSRLRLKHQKTRSLSPYVT